MPIRARQLKRLTVAAIAIAASSSVRLLAVDFPLPPMQDAFGREAEPDRNFGGGGALAVSGSSAVNAANEPQGQCESVLQFDASIATTAFDAQFGAGNWQLTAASLSVYEVGAPLNSIFNIGAGSIDFLWIAEDNWLQGTGTPMPPPIDAGGNEVSWNFLQSVAATTASSLLTSAPVTVQTGPVLIPLTLTTPFRNDILAGGFVSVFAAPATPAVGFTFRSTEYTADPTTGPRLVLTAQPLVDSDGDLNCDNVVNALDVGPFVLALTNPIAYANAFPGCSIDRADINDDGLTDGRDIADFVRVLIP